MNSDNLTIPIAPATRCCSETTAVAGGLPIVSEQLNKDACCSEKSTAGQSDSEVSAKADRSHGESCSHHSSTAVIATAALEAAVAESTPAPDDAALIDALRQVIDPELMINIVDLGLVYSINHTDKKVLVEMTLTSPACPAGPQIISQAKMSLEKLPGVEIAEIKLTMSPPWTPDRMTDDARDQLGIF
jgi:metal-sulfur cluster biosynthetic enzyme